MNREYMTPAIVELLRLIRLHEGGKANYDADYQNDDKWGDLGRYTLDQVRALGRSQVTTGGAHGGKEASSAIGGYQFLTATLDSLKADLKLTGSEMFTHDLQDDLAYSLMVRRGLNKLYAGTITIETFCNDLAMEWASLPVVTTIKGAHRTVTSGQSYYAGDGLNAAAHSPDVILNAVRAVKAQGKPASEPEPGQPDGHTDYTPAPPDIPAPEPPPIQPPDVPAPAPSQPAASGGFFAALASFFRWLFSKGN